MHSIDTTPTIGQRVNSVFAQARFITFSLLVHTIIILFGGTYAMYHQVPEPPDFVAGGGDGLMVDDAGASMPEPPPEAPQPEVQPTLAAPANSAAIIDALSTAAVSTTFAINTAPGRGISMGSLSTGNALTAQGIGEKLGQMGVGKAGGTSMIRFFGKMTEVQAVVFVFDISSSMVQGKKSPKTYDDLEDEVKRVIRTLDDKTQFGLVAFAGSAHLYKSELVAANSDEKQRAISWLRKQSPIGAQEATDPETKAKHHGTRADLGLEAAFNLNPDTVIFVSDGEPSGTNAEQVLKLISTWQQGRTRPVKINSFAYLADSGQKFMQDLAKQTTGEFREVNPKDRRRK